MSDQLGFRTTKLEYIFLMIYKILNKFIKIDKLLYLQNCIHRQLSQYKTLKICNSKLLHYLYFFLYFFNKSDMVLIFVLTIPCTNFDRTFPILTINRHETLP